ncbi:hypothetical protein LZL87_011350 [Fusarium oxysporum]|nr:hypothetical protein LZL87_011350 [Fusarium oxysporum]
MSAQSPTCPALRAISMQVSKHTEMVAEADDPRPAAKRAEIQISPTLSPATKQPMPLLKTPISSPFSKLSLRKATSPSTQKFRDQKTQGKKAVVQTRTESFETAIEGEQTTPQRRREKRKAPKTPAARRRMRSHPLVDDDDEDDERRGRCQ